LRGVAFLPDTKETVSDTDKAMPWPSDSIPSLCRRKF
jgi:hypothetical protein